MECFTANVQHSNIIYHDTGQANRCWKCFSYVITTKGPLPMNVTTEQIHIRIYIINFIANAVTVILVTSGTEAFQYFNNSDSHAHVHQLNQICS